MDRVSTLVIGAGQAGLSVGYFLTRAGIDCRIVDSGQRIGHTWRSRWDSMRLFTAAKHNHLPGMPFPGKPGHIPGKDAVADYLEGYAKHFDLPVRLDVTVHEVIRNGQQYEIDLGGENVSADHVIVATGPTGRPKVPEFARELDLSIASLHSTEYRNPEQLPDGPVLVVGAGNSGAEIAVELASQHRQVWLAGRDVGKLPVKMGGIPYRIMNRFMTTDTRMGRKFASQHSGKGTPLVRVRPEDVTRSGVQRVAAAEGVADGQPRLSDGTVLEPAVVIWCTGYVREYDWIKLPIFDDRNEPVHDRGVVRDEPGMYFLGLPFLYSMASSLIMGVTKDAEYVAETIIRRSRS